MLYDLAIIGAGPAAAAAAVYAARKRLNTIVIAEAIGGQSIVSETIYNWIGTPSIGGPQLAENLKRHMEYYTTPEHTLTLSIGKRVEKVVKEGNNFIVTIQGSDSITTRSVLVATGSSHRTLEVPGAKDFEHRGIMYCATCDGPLFSGMPVAVIGGGNAALEAVLQLSQYASHVTLLHRSESFRADAITVEQVRKLLNVTLNTNIELLEIKGAEFVNSVLYRRKGIDEIVALPLSAVFVEIGQLPNTYLVQDLLPLDEHKKIIVDPTNQRAQVEGVWAAGDCTTGRYHQNNIAAGDGVKAIEDLYIWFKKQN